MAEKNLYPSDQADKVLVRMPDGMRDRLKEAAKANNRTMNAEIVARLEQTFKVYADADAHMVGRSALHAEADVTVQKGMLKSFEKSNLENRLMELLTQRSYENHNLIHYEDRLEYLEDDLSEDAKFERHVIEHERSSALRKLGALDEAINATYEVAKQKGIDLDPEEINKRFKPSVNKVTKSFKSS